MDLTSVEVLQFYTFLLVFARVAGVIGSAPPFNNQAIPMQIKAGLAAVLSMAITPLAAGTVGPLPSHLLVLAGEVAKNALFGLALGFLVQAVFAAVEIAGQLSDLQMGFGAINLLNPFSERQDSLMATFLLQLATTLFLLANGHLVLMSVLRDSFALVPLGSFVPHASIGLAVIPSVQTMCLLGFRLALPTLGVILVTDVAFGLIARMAPQVNVFIVGIPAKMIIGMGTITLLLPVMTFVVGQLMLTADTGLRALAAGAH